MDKGQLRVPSSEVFGIFSIYRDISRETRTIEYRTYIMNIYFCSNCRIMDLYKMNYLRKHSVTSVKFTHLKLSLASRPKRSIYFFHRLVPCSVNSRGRRSRPGGQLARISPRMVNSGGIFISYGLIGSSFLRTASGLSLCHSLG
jgi:hypothetical protein